MNLGDFHEVVSSALARGTALDEQIPSFVRQAARWLERNYTFNYMKQFVGVSIDVSELDTPRYIELGAQVPKAIPFFRWVMGDGSYQKCDRVEASDQDSLTDATAALPPTGFWLDGVRRLVLNQTPTEDLEGELRLDRYTAWSTDDDFEHWLIDYAEDVLLARTMIHLGARTKDRKLMEFYAPLFKDGITGLLLAEDELAYAGQTARMEYRPAG